MRTFLTIYTKLRGLRKFFYRKHSFTFFFLLVFIFYNFFCFLSANDDIIIDNFSGKTQEDGLPSGWKELIFKKSPRKTEYTLVKENENYFLQAVSKAAASGIFKKVEIDPKLYPIISWRWKIEHTIKKGDERKKEGDDYAARIYITFKFDPEKEGYWEKAKFSILRKFYGEYPPKAALNYIWANKLSKGEEIDNVYINRAKMIAVESGESQKGRWITEERNLYEDYKKYFREEPPEIIGIVLMTDTDNTGEEAVAYYDDIILKYGNFNVTPERQFFQP